MRIAIAWVLIAAAGSVVLLNIFTVYRHWKHGQGKSATPALASILAVIGIGLFAGAEVFFKWWPVILLTVAIVDFGSWILTAYLFKRLR